MTRTAHQYEFRAGTDPRDVEDTLPLDLLAAEGVFSEARVRLDSAYRIDQEARTATADASTAVGQIVNGIFAAFAIREFGRDGFTARRRRSALASPADRGPAFIRIAARVVDRAAGEAVAQASAGRGDRLYAESVAGADAVHHRPHRADPH